MVPWLLKTALVVGLVVGTMVEVGRPAAARLELHGLARDAANAAEANLVDHGRRASKWEARAMVESEGAQLVDFGSHGFPALHYAMTNVAIRYTADVTAALIESRRKSLVDIPPNLLPALEDAVWFGSSDARRLAIPELALYQYRPALLACIDAGLEDRRCSSW